MGYKRTGRPTGRPKAHKYTDKDWELAKRLLEDGASYREVAYTTGIPKSTLRDNLPGMSQWTPAQGRAMISFIKKHQEMFDELYDPGRRKG